MPINILRQSTSLAAAIMIMVVLAATASVEPEFTWGGRAPHPAVVNPVLGEDPSAVISLRGEWEFVSFDSAKPYRNGVWPKMYKETTKFWKDSRKILVPGCWEAQGVGTSATGIPCFVKWDVGPKPMKHIFQGVGWYRKNVQIPAAWAGRRIWLKTGWVNSIGMFWVNGQPVAYDESYCGTYKYEVTDFVTPGSNAVDE